MKSLLQYSFILFSLGFVLSSCNEEVELVGDFQETAVVYGILDQADSVHFIKINRAFIGPGNAYEIAQIPDSSYFENVDATISEVLNGDVIRVWTLKDTLIENKDVNGVFYAPVQKVYYFETLPCKADNTQNFSADPLKTSLNNQATFKLNININNGELVVSSETKLVNGVYWDTPSVQNFIFKFADDPGSYTSPSILAKVGTAHVLSSSLDITFNEFVAATPTPKTFKWRLGETGVEGLTNKSFSANGQTFFNLMRSSVSDDASIDRRTFVGITLTLTGGAEELYNYMTVNQPSSSLAQNKPTYTNLSIEGNGRVIGIFSARQTMKYYKPFYANAAQAWIRAIDKKTTRELCSGPITGDLFFCSNHPGDLTETYACQ